MADTGYNVVIYHTKTGAITWTTLSSEAKFDKWKLEMLGDDMVLDKGVTDKRAIELCENAPFACKLSAVVQKATDPDGNVNHLILGMEIKGLLLAEAYHAGEHNAT